MTREKTTAAKLVEAAEGQHPEGKRGLYDAAAKNLVAARQILAWIVKKCIREAQHLSVVDIATKYIAGEPEVRKKAVYRDDAEAEDPGRARLDQTEDASITEGTVRYDILFTLNLPGEKEPITVIVNVEVQNRIDLPYPLAVRGISYASRMLGSQGPDYNNLHKVYSIWIISNPEEERENTITSHVWATRTDDGPLQEIESDADLMEVVFLNLGEPEPVQDPEHPDVLWLLDALFSKKLTTSEKMELMETNFDIPMTKEMEDYMETMQANRLWFEADAEKRGREAGRDEGQRQMLYSLVKKGKLTMAEAAEEVGVSIQMFQQDMDNADVATLNR